MRSEPAARIEPSAEPGSHNQVSEENHVRGGKC